MLDYKLMLHNSWFIRAKGNFVNFVPSLCTEKKWEGHFNT